MDHGHNRRRLYIDAVPVVRLADEHTADLSRRQRSSYRDGLLVLRRNDRKCALRVAGMGLLNSAGQYNGADMPCLYGGVVFTVSGVFRYSKSIDMMRR